MQEINKQIQYALFGTYIITKFTLFIIVNIWQSAFKLKSKSMLNATGSLKIDIFSCTVQYNGCPCVRRIVQLKQRQNVKW